LRRILLRIASLLVATLGLVLRILIVALIIALVLLLLIRRRPLRVSLLVVWRLLLVVVLVVAWLLWRRISGGSIVSIVAGSGTLIVALIKALAWLLLLIILVLILLTILLVSILVIGRRPATIVAAHDEVTGSDVGKWRRENRSQEYAGTDKMSRGKLDLIRGARRLLSAQVVPASARELMTFMEGSLEWRRWRSQDELTTKEGNATQF
jgi:hypothetical protein